MTKHDHHAERGSRARRTAAPTEEPSSRAREGNPFLEGLTGISIVAVIALAAGAIAMLLAIAISLAY